MATVRWSQAQQDKSTIGSTMQSGLPSWKGSISATISNVYRHGAGIHTHGLYSKRGTTLLPVFMQPFSRMASRCYPQFHEKAFFFFFGSVVLKPEQF